MEGIFNIQADLSNYIKKTYSNYKKSPKDRITLEYVEAKLENLEKDWNLFKSNHTKLCSELKADVELSKIPYFSKEIYETSEENYLQYKSVLRSAIKNFKIVPVVQTESQSVKEESSFVRLPKIEIPTFSGCYSEWTSFRDLFLSLIHNNKTLDDVQKLHYLKTHIRGEAAQILKYTSITEKNYDACWGVLEQRFNNKKYLATHTLTRLLSQKKLVCESACGLKDLLNNTFDCLGELNNLGIDTTSWDVIVIHLIAHKFDAESRKQWEIHINTQQGNTLPTLTDLKSFLETRYRALEFVDNKPKAKFTSGISGSHTRATTTFLATKTSIKCEYCQAEHKLCFCKKFGQEQVKSRREFVAKGNLCYNCLGSNHQVTACKVPTSCKICHKRHHTLLHRSDQPTQPNLVKQSSCEQKQSEQENSTVTCMSMQVSRSEQALLATALVQAEASTGLTHTLRVMLDPGSMPCLITEATVQMLQLKKQKISSDVTGVGGELAVRAKGKVVIKIKSRVNPEFSMNIEAYVIKNITSFLPERDFGIQAIDWLDKNLTLADPQFNKSNKIDLLLGVKVCNKLVFDEIKWSPGGGDLMAQNTHLGWVISGSVASNIKRESSNIMVMHTQINEDDVLRKFWEIEDEPYSTRKLWTEEEKKCEEIFKSTTSRTTEGRYVVKLPFRDTEPNCIGGNSRGIAERKFKSLEKQLSKDIKLKDDYTTVINEYLELGHMKMVNKEDQNQDKAVYLPHHAVVRNDKTTTKVRVVFNASSKNKYQVSLNDTLMVGPKLQPDLRHLVLRWRTHPIALVADIVKMYRMVQIAEEDRRYQRLLWREHPNGDIQDYELSTVTFGTASAPFLAVRALNQVSIDEGTDYPLAAPKVIQSFYMDDLMTGCADEQEGIEIYKQMTELLKKGGFILQKWNSNSDKLLSRINKDSEQAKNNHKGKPEIQKEKKLQSNKDIDIKDESTTKVLGLVWNRNEDNFQYLVNLPLQTMETYTKRSVLSIIARLYDPLGWIAPSIIIGKIFIQKLWLSGLGWDEPLSEELKKEWQTYYQDLSDLTSVQIQRWLGTRKNENGAEIHGFCDASKLAYSAVVYYRTVSDEGQVTVSLLTAKTRVAPIKQISIPRLELCGASLLAQLLAEVAEVLGVQKSNIRAWTDSTVVLCWINNHPSKWKTFVANRVSAILSTLSPSHWHHVSTKINPADLASRGVKPAELAETKLWFQGPEFLRYTISYEKPSFARPIHTDEEAICLHTIKDEQNWIERFSKLGKLQRTVAYMRRFCRRNATPYQTYLTKLELDQALTCCIRKVQGEEFAVEYMQLQNNSLLLKSSKLKALCPYLDENKIMRVSGRLQNSHLPEESKHPIILPHSSHLTKLIVANAHQVTLHGGIQLMMNYLRSRYWIIGLKNIVKHHIHECVVCVRHKSKVQTPYMGDLPEERCTPAKPFTKTGVDYAGPVKIKASRMRGVRSYKGYIAVFVCMATKAIHLEAVSDMTTQTFLAAFRRFIARRGPCTQLWSDNGTTFVGAAKELKELKNIQKKVASTLEGQGTEWRFIPPHSPHWGGLWEAGVKSTKFHIRRVIGETILTFEEITTLLAQIEACLNSRPLCTVNTDHTEPLPLTPGHFLVGGPLLTLSEVNYLDSNINTLSRWQLVQRLHQNFWKRWSQEYLHTLMNRKKWTSQVPEPAEGCIVLIKEDGIPPSRWLMGRVLKKHPGPDNITRVVTLQVKNNILKRPTSKLCLLPVMDK